MINIYYFIYLDQSHMAKYPKKILMTPLENAFIVSFVR